MAFIADFNSGPWQGGDTPPYVSFYTGPTNWNALYDVMRKPLGNLPDILKSFGGAAAPFIDIKNVLKKDADLGVLFRSHASLKAGVEDITDLSDHVLRPGLYEEPTLYNMPDGTANIFTYKLEGTGAALKHELVAHYGIGSVVDKAEAATLLSAVLGHKAQDVALFGQEGQGCFKDAHGRLCLSNTAITKEIIAPPKWSAAPSGPEL